MDFTDADKSGDCFALVQKLHGCTYNEALRIVDKTFGLGICDTSNLGEYKKIVSVYKQPEECKEHHSIMIQMITRKFTKEELVYWEKYHVDAQELRDNHIYSIEKMFLNRKRFSLKDTELRFGYLYHGRWWKLYRPNNSKKTKWLSNVPLSLAGGLENLDKEHNTLIVDSMKDYLVCKKIYSNVVLVQNESISAFSQKTVDCINSNSKEIFVGFDSDSAGKFASLLVTSMFGWKHINTPDNLLPEVKDWSDWVKVAGIEIVRNHFVTKGLFG
jgi:hypothetical protein